MAMILVSILTIFQESGVHAALVQRRDRIQEAVDAATAYTPVVGLLLAGICLAAAPLAGRFRLLDRAARRPSEQQFIPLRRRQPAERRGVEQRRVSR
jgi:hypothetical protein